MIFEIKILNLKNNLIFILNFDFRKHMLVYMHVCEIYYLQMQVSNGHVWVRSYTAGLLRKVIVALILVLAVCIVLLLLGFMPPRLLLTLYSRSQRQGPTGHRQGI